MNKTDFKPANELIEQFSLLRDRIIGVFNGRSTGPLAIAFTSYEQKEGVSSIVANFAGMLSLNQHYKVLLVDANIQNPSMSNFFPVDHDEANDNELEIEPNQTFAVNGREIVRANQYLDVIVSRRKSEKIPPIFKKAEFAVWLQKAKEQYDFIIIDCPPLNENSISAAFSCKADGVVLVVEAERVRGPVLKRATDQLEMLGANILGVVLNKRKYPIPSFVYRML